jgi:hypothetical protein
LFALDHLGRFSPGAGIYANKRWGGGRRPGPQA